MAPWLVGRLAETEKDAAAAAFVDLIATDADGEVRALCTKSVNLERQERRPPPSAVVGATLTPAARTPLREGPKLPPKKTCAYHLSCPALKQCGWGQPLFNWRHVVEHGFDALHTDIAMHRGSVEP